MRLCDSAGIKQAQHWWIIYWMLIYCMIEPGILLLIMFFAINHGVHNYSTYTRICCKWTLQSPAFGISKWQKTKCWSENVKLSSTKFTMCAEHPDEAAVLWHSDTIAVNSCCSIIPLKGSYTLVMWPAQCIHQRVNTGWIRKRALNYVLLQTHLQRLHALAWGRSLQQKTWARKGCRHSNT